MFTLVSRRRAALRRSVLGLAVAALAASCATTPQNAIRDLAAIHTEDTWQPRSPAAMTVAPAVYLGNVSTEALEQSGVYEVEDHLALELAILDAIGRSPWDDPPLSLEATSWLLVELLHDPEPEARVRSAAILSQFAAAWITEGGARLPATATDRSLVEAVRAVEDADDQDAFLAALRLLERAPLGDGDATIRLLAGVGRKAGALGVGRRHASAALLWSTALRAVLHGLELCAEDDPDPEVREACRARLDILLPYARPGA